MGGGSGNARLGSGECMEAMKPREGSHGGCFLAHVCHDSIKHVGFGLCSHGYVH